ncbi:MAG: formate dehydrogenase subunit gamma [Desulfovibrionaceae bacterium]|nr:formate dehydrogenase subunit gamma [Desulfovibrionaceae bacterium]
MSQQLIDAAIRRHAGAPGGLLPILHDVQDALGYIPPEAVPAIAGALNLSRAEVHGVLTGYPLLRTAPPGRHTVRVCRAEACQAVGGDALMAHAEQRLGCAQHGTTANGAVSLEPVFCLGLCASGPAIAVDERPHARVTPERFDQLADRLLEPA